MELLTRTVVAHQWLFSRGLGAEASANSAPGLLTPSAAANPASRNAPRPPGVLWAYHLRWSDKVCVMSTPVETKAA